jgi:hypothetical protein
MGMLDLRGRGLPAFSHVDTVLSFVICESHHVFFVHSDSSIRHPALSGAYRQEAPTAKDKHEQVLVLKGVGINSAWLFVMEFFGWRALRNRKEVDALSSLSAYSGAFCPPSRCKAAP